MANSPIIDIAVPELKDKYTSPWIDCRQAKNVRLHWRSDTKGSPVGALSVEGSEDSRLTSDVFRSTKSTADAADAVPLTLAQDGVHGQGLSVFGPNSTLIDISDPPSFIRLVYTPASGGKGTVVKLSVGRRLT